MIAPRLLFACVLVAVFNVVAGRDAAAGDYVWAQSQWGSSPVASRSSSFSNGYGGYYVPKNSYGNNHESQQPFKNPNGVVIPAETGTCPAPAAAQPTRHPMAKPWQLFKLHRGSQPATLTNTVPNPTIQTAPIPPTPVTSK